MSDTEVGRLVIAELSDPERLARLGVARFRAFAAHRGVKVQAKVAERLVAAAKAALPAADAEVARVLLVLGFNATLDVVGMWFQSVLSWAQLFLLPLGATWAAELAADRSAADAQGRPAVLRALSCQVGEVSAWRRFLSASPTRRPSCARGCCVALIRLATTPFSPSSRRCTWVARRCPCSSP